MGASFSFSSMLAGLYILGGTAYVRSSSKDNTPPGSLCPERCPYLLLFKCDTRRLSPPVQILGVRCYPSVVAPAAQKEMPWVLPIVHNRSRKTSYDCGTL
ncbi:uncharacterized protein F4817DRAFT_329128 [Daldinia loculata]|uniref:uncharacterized protein n=1 Tax=Daldinia loculata TaxID=103429 RepID=UPI0020C250C1|nr:uncharacterized protein F4817DRAFT_329128 [Daldinia loculata]KAI1649922.1 hypothetical protein F4817DRAFT_329128 [Daldinia loculata]